MSPASLDALTRIEKWLRFRENVAAGVETPPQDRIALHYDDVKMLHSLVLSKRQVGAVYHAEVVVTLADNLSEEGFGKMSDAVVDADLDETVRVATYDALAKLIPASLLEIGPFDVTVSEVPAS